MFYERKVSQYKVKVKMKELKRLNRMAVPTGRVFRL